MMWRQLLVYSVPWLLLVAAVSLVFGQLPSPMSIFELWRPWAQVGALACGMAAIMLTGGIDLSVGSMLVLGTTVLGVLWQRFGWPIELASAACLVTGGLAGCLNGTLVLAGIAPLVATLATMALFAGLAMAVSGGERIAGFPDPFCRWGQGDLWGVPHQLYLLGAVALVAYLVVHHTRFGRYLYAIGDNRLAADYAAVPVRRIEWSLYAANGLLVGLVAVAYAARNGAAVPDPERGLELQTIACVVLGGTRVTGGAGGIPRTLLGLAVFAHLEIGMRLLGAQKLLDAQGRLLVLGALVIGVAIWNEQFALRRR